MRRLALLPLDDRPCNRIFPRRLADIAGVQLSAPPLRLLGGFTCPGDSDALAAWLLQASRSADGLIVSLDMLAYGGLIASRTPAVPLWQALARLAALREIRRQHPGLPIFAFSIIMRLGITVDSEDAAHLHAQIKRWAELTDAVRRLRNSRHRAELQALEQNLPPRVRECYLQLRKRNHSVNLAAIDLAAQGVLDYLILAQEDAAPAGLHIPEQRRLRQAARASGAAARVSVHPGADEAGMVLLARHLCAGLGRGPRILPVYVTRSAANLVAGYEDRPIGATVKAQIEAAGARVATDRRNPDMFLLVHTPAGQPREAWQAERYPYPEKRLRRFLRQVESHLELGPVALADCAYSNGADPALAQALQQRSILARLHAYAAWNTAGNAIGTCVAHGLARLISPRTARTERTHRRFLFERLLDDYAYQTIIRQQAMARARRLALSPLNLGTKRLQLQRFVSRRLQALSRTIWRANFPGPCPTVRARLPWPRLFEVEIAAGARRGHRAAG